jgi:hypothetical protein
MIRTAELPAHKSPASNALIVCPFSVAATNKTDQNGF